MVTAVRLTYEDYANTPEGERYELIDGELIRLVSPNIAHQDNLRKLGYRMAVFAERGDAGAVYFPDTDVVLSDNDVVRPDLLFISKERAHILTYANIQGAPDLVVEILSPSTARRDWGVKRELYARHGVKEYWITDPGNKIVWVMPLKDSVLEIKQTCYLGDTIASSVLAGFTVKVNDIFA